METFIQEHCVNCDDEKPAEEDFFLQKRVVHFIVISSNSFVDIAK